MKPPPPRLPAAGWVTASANATAMAASTALPPRFITSTPTRDATSFVDDTIPCFARTGSREAAAAVESECVTNEGSGALTSKKVTLRTKRRGSLRDLFIVNYLCLELAHPVKQPRTSALLVYCARLDGKRKLAKRSMPTSCVWKQTTG